MPIYVAHRTLPRNSEYVLKIGSASKLSDEILVKRSDLWFPIAHLDDYPIKNNLHLHSKVKPIITFFLRDADFRSELNNPSTLSSSNYRDVKANNYIPLARSLSSKFSIVKMGRGTKYRQDQDNQFWYNYYVSQDN